MFDAKFRIWNNIIKFRDLFYNRINSTIHWNVYVHTFKVYCKNKHFLLNFAFSNNFSKRKLYIWMESNLLSNLLRKCHTYQQSDFPKFSILCKNMGSLTVLIYSLHIVSFVLHSFSKYIWLPLQKDSFKFRN